MAQQMTENLAAAACPEDIETPPRKPRQMSLPSGRKPFAKASWPSSAAKRARLVDPLQFEMSIQGRRSDRLCRPGWEIPAAQRYPAGVAGKAGHPAGRIDSAGKAGLLLERLEKRRRRD